MQKIKEEKMNKNPKTLEAVHTHTHTHTHSYLKTRKKFYIKNKEQKLAVLLIVGADDHVCPQKITAVEVCSSCI
jgi:hypothetical protein